jgi:hypothetical protein
MPNMADFQRTFNSHFADNSVVSESEIRCKQSLPVVGGRPQLGDLEAGGLVMEDGAVVVGKMRIGRSLLRSDPGNYQTRSESKTNQPHREGNEPAAEIIILSAEACLKLKAVFPGVNDDNSFQLFLEFLDK